MTKAVSEAAAAVPAEAPIETREHRFRLADYAVLLKPRVMSLVVFTAVVGLALAPGPIEAWRALAAVISIALGAGAAGAINMWYDRDIDAWMARTRNRPACRPDAWSLAQPSSSGRRCRWARWRAWRRR